MPRSPSSQPSVAYSRYTSTATPTRQLVSHWGFCVCSGSHSTLNHLASVSPGAHELEQMQLILETIPVIREEDKDELLRVMPCFVSSTWEVKRPLRKLLPEVNSEGSSIPRG